LSGYVVADFNCYLVYMIKITIYLYMILIGR